MLFALKSNSNLRFYIDYRKLNIITKKNRYSFSLIKKVIEKIINYKYLTRLDIIITFNKLRIHPDSEDFIIFIIILRAYKYRVLLFNLINNLNSF